VRVLVVESDRGAAVGPIADLQAAGHEVVRCHDTGQAAFPCNALADDGSCPLETADGVDVVLDYRARPHPKPTAFEDGVSCALRRHVPLVVMGTSALNPYERWTTAVADTDDVVGACERAVARPIERLAGPARAEIRSRLRRQGMEPGLADVADVLVRRARGQLDATVDIPETAIDTDESLAVAVAGVIRANDRFASRVNVAVKRARSIDD
jgi:hypothetical protein